MDIKKKKKILQRARKTKNATLFRKAKHLDKEFRRTVNEEKKQKIGETSNIMTRSRSGVQLI